jgi:hypothetical protein
MPPVYDIRRQPALQRCTSKRRTLGLLPGSTPAAVVTATTRRKVPGQGCELTDGADAADAGRRPSPAAMAREPVVCTVSAQPDERCLTCGNPKMILTASESDVHPPFSSARPDGRAGTYPALKDGPASRTWSSAEVAARTRVAASRRPPLARSTSTVS